MDYRTAFDRITKAYYKGELNPYITCGCFCGNLLQGNGNWSCNLDKANNFYTYEELKDLEKHFLSDIKINNNKEGLVKYVDWSYYSVEDPKYLGSEEALFKAMESTLEMLRTIHEDKGEVIEDYNFVKRELVEV